MRTQVCIYGEPQGKGRPRFSTVCGHVKTRTPDQTVIYENLVKTEYRNQSGVRFPDDAMLDVRVMLHDIGWCDAEKDSLEDGWDKAIDEAIRQLDYGLLAEIDIRGIKTADVAPVQHGRCPYCGAETNDFIPLNQTVEYSGIEIALNRQGMLRVRVYEPGKETFSTQDIVEIKHCTNCGAKMDGGVDDAS